MNDENNSCSYGIKLKVVGVGGAGNNSINFLLNEPLDNIDYFVVNTDHQALSISKCENKLLLGSGINKGCGTGNDPEMGKQMAIDSTEDIKTMLSGTDLLILCAGFGGGTGTGATPVIAKIAKELNILTIAVVTNPFETFEGTTKKVVAAKGINELKKYVDSYIIVSNQKLLDNYKHLPFMEALKYSNVILQNTIKIIYDILFEKSCLNIDLNDLRNVFKNGNEAIVGYCKDSSKDKVKNATQKALKNPLFESDIKTCTKMLVNFKFDSKVPLEAIQVANAEIDKVFDNRSNSIQKKIGVMIDQSNDKNDYFEVGIIASGLNDDEQLNTNVIKNFDAINNSDDINSDFEAFNMSKLNVSNHTDELVNETVSSDKTNLPEFLV
ncbi:cell division protein FtsZ [Mycoplasmopsis felifaucium]|uniref:cell division protein FtsZ n=1 Tax=Mycoplasmopsis felifaucium TaxID=35768 RepID=UPI00068F3224|nr:cell division protein FtsZ [Mycoplasmopsis felifaucium]